jgi:hypothetical protein
MMSHLVHSQVLCRHALTFIAGRDVFGPQGDEVAGGEAWPALHEARDKK